MSTLMFVVPPTQVKRTKTKLKTLTGGPPDMPPDEKQIGPYCIKAVTSCVDDNDNVISDFIGYSKDYSILEQTKRACLRNKGKYEGTTCTEPQMTPIPTQNVNNCDGHIVHKNYEKKLTSIMFPK